MKSLYAPWRSNYVKDDVRGKTEDTQKQDCAFCQKISINQDSKHFILGRFNHFVVMLNLYPYNAGHLLIVALDHKNCLKDLTPDARKELIELTSASTDILQNTMKAQGINIGINIGKAAGASIPAHLHEHILPRWVGDTNFLPTLAETKQISVDLPQLYKQLKPHFQAIKLQ